MSALLELAERCEKATGPDDDLDVEISVAMGGKGDLPPKHRWNTTPHYTASLDAAMTLVPEGSKIMLQSHGSIPGPMAMVEPNERFRSAATLPLALCAAALRARAAQGDQA